MRLFQFLKRFTSDYRMFPDHFSSLVLKELGRVYGLSSGPRTWLWFCFPHSLQGNSSQCLLPVTSFPNSSLIWPTILPQQLKHCHKDWRLTVLTDVMVLLTPSIHVLEYSLHISHKNPIFHFIEVILSCCLTYAVNKVLLNTPVNKQLS